MDSEYEQPSMEIDIPLANDVPSPTIYKNTTTSLWSVSPNGYGEGLPYAPIDWPKPGDIWSWKVGSRINSFGYHCDRLLIAPTSLQKFPSRRLSFRSECSARRYLRAQFSDDETDAFFALFSWKIPATTTPVGKEQITPHREKPASQKKSDKVEREKTPKKAKRKQELILYRRTRSSLKKTARFTKNKDTNNNFDLSLTDSPEKSPVSHPLNSDDFDNYLNSVEKILLQPISRPPFLKNEMSEARKKLSSLLNLDLPMLISSKILEELMTLSSTLQNDPNLSDEQISMLNLVREIPHLSNEFREIKEIESDAEKFFENLEAKIASANDLRNEYVKSKGNLVILQADIDSGSAVIAEINEHIAILQSRRDEAVNCVEDKKKEMEKIVSNQKRVVECLPRVVNEVQLANVEKEKWEVKKKRSEEKEAEILSKFAPLKGFSF